MYSEVGENPFDIGEFHLREGIMDNLTIRWRSYEPQATPGKAYCIEINVNGPEYWHMKYFSLASAPMSDVHGPGQLCAGG